MDYDYEYDYEKLVDVVKDLNITINVVKGAELPLDLSPDSRKWHETAFSWTIQLAYKGKLIVTPYWTGSGLKRVVPGTTSKHEPIPPTAADVLYSLAMDAWSAGQSFEDFCAEGGRDADSVKALRAYEQAKEWRRRMIAVFGEMNLERMARAEH